MNFFLLSAALLQSGHALSLTDWDYRSNGEIRRVQQNRRNQRNRKRWEALRKQKNAVLCGSRYARSCSNCLLRHGECNGDCKLNSGTCQKKQ